MAATVAITARKANSGTDARTGNGACGRRLTARVIHAARALWPSKVAAHLAGIAGVNARSAERWLSGEQELSAEALGRLIHSEAGLEFLTAVMADARPAWWGYVKKASRLGFLRAQQQKLQEALHEEEQIGAALARAETAMGNVDPDYFGIQIDAARQMRRASDRAVAAKGRGR